MKVGIITIIDNNNYGNRLQNYALQTILNKYCTVETIKNNPNDDFPFLLRFQKKLFYKLHIIKKLLLHKLTIKRIQSFRKFNKNINFSKKKYNINKLKHNNNYDLFIVGSDQIWNPYHNRLSNIDVLKRIASNKCFSYAASFGVSNFQESDYLNIIKEEIGKFQKISVREESGKKIIEDICHRKDIQIVLDPTMLLSEKDWDVIIAQSTISVKKKYILLYFLGNLDNCKYNKISLFAKENNCEIINVLDTNSKYFNCGPAEFLYLIKHSFTVFSDSFHACALSIVLRKSFFVFEREDNTQSMNSRIETLLKTFDLENCIVFQDEPILKSTINYSIVFQTLEICKKYSLDFLSDIFK